MGGGPSTQRKPRVQENRGSKRNSACRRNEEGQCEGGSPGRWVYMRADIQAGVRLGFSRPWQGIGFLFHMQWEAPEGLYARRRSN